jgi:hypothetical protein
MRRLRVKEYPTDDPVAVANIVVVGVPRAEKTGWLMPEESLTLVRSNKSRPSGEWSALCFPYASQSRFSGKRLNRNVC